MLSSAHDVQAEASAYKSRAAPHDADHACVWQNRNTHTFHFGKLSKELVLACVRTVSQSYSKCSEIPVVLWPRCGGCFGTVHQHVESDENLL